MNVFISWSGWRSRLVAEAFHDSLRTIFSGRLNVYFSANMNKGIRWNEALNRAMQEADFAILCMTKENYAAPWMMYEAGVLSQTAGADAVTPFLLDADFPKFHGPVTEFRQCAVFEKADLKKLILTIYRIYMEQGNDPIDEDIVERSFEMEYDEPQRGLGKRLKDALDFQEEDGAEDMARKTLAGVEQLLRLSIENQTLLKEIVSGLK